MFKTATILALGFAVASVSAFERDLQGQVVTNGGFNITTTCIRGTTESCSANPGYCCAGVTKNGTAANTNTTLGVCAPAEFHTQSFVVAGTTWAFNCALPATATTLATTLGSCNTTSPCGNTTTQCCAPRTWTVGGVAGSAAAKSSCISMANSGVQYLANWNVTAQGSLIAAAQVSAVCPSSDSGSGSFGAYIKVSAMMVLALVAGMFF